MSRYVPALQGYASSKLYDLEEMCERAGILELHLIDETQRRLRMSFSKHLAFRKADEGDSLVTIHAISATSQLGRSFYLVEDSEYVCWFVDQGYGIWRDRIESLLHLTVATVDDVIDIITLELPVVYEEQTPSGGNKRTDG